MHIAPHHPYTPPPSTHTTLSQVMVDRDGDGTIEAHEIAMQTIENVSLRLQAFLAAIAHESIMGTALRFMLLFIPWPFYIAVFQVRRMHTREEQTHGTISRSLCPCAR